MKLHAFKRVTHSVVCARTVFMVCLFFFSGGIHAQEIVADEDSGTEVRIDLQTALNLQESDPVYASELYQRVIDQRSTAQTELTEDEQRSVDRELRVAAFNLGVLQLRSSLFGEAADSFRLAGQHGVNRTDRRDAMYNLGHALNGSIGMDGQIEMDPAKLGETIEKLRQVERAFLDASHADPDFVEAKKNVERIRKQIQQLEDMKEQIEQQQEQDSEQSEQQGEEGESSDGQGNPGERPSDQLQELADQQREQAQESEAAQENQSELSQEERSEAQEDLSEETQELSEQLEQALEEAEPDAAESTQSALEDAMEAQEEAQEALERGDSATAAEKQQEAADALDRAAQEMRASEEQQEQSEQESEQNAQGQAPQQPGEGEPEINEIARQLLDKERQERERRQVYRATGRPVQVEEDW
ncbi:MAG: DUF4175 family protein [Phycisphaerales bacterium]